jgi:hypothetical protein
MATTKKDTVDKNLEFEKGRNEQQLRSFCLGQAVDLVRHKDEVDTAHVLETAKKFWEFVQG